MSALVPGVVAAPKMIPLFVDVQCDDELLAGRLRASLVAQLNAIGDAVIVGTEQQAEYAVRLAALVGRSRDGLSRGWVGSYALTGYDACGHTDGSVITYMTSGVLTGGSDTSDINDIMSSLSGTVDKRLLVYARRNR